jgi:hypothetical protein
MSHLRKDRLSWQYDAVADVELQLLLKKPCGPRVVITGQARVIGGQVLQ